MKNWVGRKENGGEVKERINNSQVSGWRVVLFTEKGKAGEEHFKFFLYRMLVVERI